MAISFTDWQKLELRVGTIKEAVHLPDSSKLLKLQIELGSEQRQILAGIAAVYQPEDLIGKQIVIVANLEPKTIMGETSQGMLLAADNEGGPVLLQPDKKVPPGTGVR